MPRWRSDSTASSSTSTPVMSRNGTRSRSSTRQRWPLTRWIALKRWNPEAKNNGPSTRTSRTAEQLSSVSAFSGSGSASGIGRTVNRDSS